VQTHAWALFSFTDWFLAMDRRSHISHRMRELHITAHDFIEWRKAMMEATAEEVESVANRPARHWSR
jgi:hypothetical protein